MEVFRVGLHEQIGRLDVFMQSIRSSLAGKLVKVARTPLEVLFGGFLGVKNSCKCTKLYGCAKVGQG